MKGFIANNWQTILSTGGFVGAAGLATYFAYKTCKDTGNCPQYSDPDRFDPIRTEPIDAQSRSIYDRIHRDTHGRRKIEGFQEHHIISDKNDKTRNHKIWQKAGMSPNDPENKMFLPTEEGNHPTRSIHRGRHWKKVSDDQVKKLDGIVDQGEKEGWTQQQFKDKLLDFIREERQRLRSGDADLNSINRHNPTGGK